MALPDTPFSNAKLRLARLLNGWTKAELAERLQVSRQFVHALEIGEKTPSNELLPALALVLRVQPAFFTSALEEEVREGECHFRSRRNMPDKLAEQIIAHGTAVESLVRYLERSLTLPKVDFRSRISKSKTTKRSKLQQRNVVCIGNLDRDQSQTCAACSKMPAGW